MTESSSNSSAQLANVSDLNHEELPVIKPLIEEQTNNVVDEQPGLFSMGQPNRQTTTSVPLLEVMSSCNQPPPQQGRKMVIQVVDEEEENKTWAATVSKPTASTESQEKLTIEDLDTCDVPAVDIPTSPPFSGHTDDKEAGGEKEKPLVSSSTSEHDIDVDKEEDIPWFEQAGKVPESILHEYDTRQQRIREKTDLAEEDLVWKLAGEVGSTLEEDKVELDEETTRKLRETVIKSRDSTSLCFWEQHTHTHTHSPLT